MKSVFIYCLSLFLVIGIQAQNHKPAIIKSAKAFASAQQKNNTDKLIALTHPNIVKMAGGAEAYASIINETEILKKQQGFKTLQINTVSVGDCLDAGAEIHAVVTRTIIIGISDSKFKTESYLLASSSDRGESWSFVDLEAYNYDNILDFFPDFNPNMILPRTKQPEPVD